jgi:hypothetical protein
MQIAPVPHASTVSLTIVSQKQLSARGYSWQVYASNLHIKVQIETPKAAASLICHPASPIRFFATSFSPEQIIS